MIHDLQNMLHDTGFVVIYDCIEAKLILKKRKQFTKYNIIIIINKYNTI